MTNNIQNKHYSSKYNLSDYRSKPQKYYFTSENNANKIIFKNNDNKYAKILDVNCFNTCLKAVTAWKEYYQECYNNVKEIRNVVEQTKPIVNDGANVSLNLFNSLVTSVKKVVDDFNAIDAAGCLKQAKVIRENNITSTIATLRKYRDSRVVSRARNESDAGANLASEIVDYWS